MNITQTFLKKSLALAGGLAASVLVSGQSSAQQNSAERVPSTCLAIAQKIHSPEIPVQFARFTSGEPVLVTRAATNKYDVTFSYQGHSTYLIESPDGVKIATDFSGWLTDKVTPDVVTMNQAHSSHYTNNPDPAIKTPLKGWGENGEIAKHHLMVGDVLIRNVTTDILRFSGIPDGNSIFIFETGGLCIGHLGHLHHKLTDNHYAKIGRLDVVMIAVDGGMTMSQLSAKNIINRLRSSVILPMHVRSFGALPRFLTYLGEGYPVQRLSKNRLTLNLRNLPKQPTVMILPGVGSYYEPDE